MTQAPQENVTRSPALCSSRQNVGLEIWTLKQLLRMVSWVEEVLGDKDGGKKNNCELWHADNPLWHLPSNHRKLGVLFESHSVL